MSKIRQLMKRCTQALGKKRIALRLSISKNTVRSFIEAIHRLNTPREELQKLSDYELNQRINPPQTQIANPRMRGRYTLK